MIHEYVYMYIVVHEIANTPSARGAYYNGPFHQWTTIIILLCIGQLLYIIIKDPGNRVVLISEVALELEIS